MALEIIKRSCIGISPDAMELLKNSYARERNPAAKAILKAIISNVELAIKENKPVCQSPGYPVVYVKMGGDVKIDAGIQKTFQKALIEATKNGYLRPSIVHPLTRQNPGDNSGIGVPDVEIEYVTEVDYVEFIISFKGCGAELANVVKVLTPKQVGKNGAGIKKLVLESVIDAGGIPCPPVAIGVGIGGQIHYAAKLSRKAVSIKKWNDENPDYGLSMLEKELLNLINSLGIGPAGIGGDTTALAVKVECVATHTAICPVAINFHCWAARRSGVRIYQNKEVEYLF
ncbi:MAG: fumarate hydratase [Candidatus Bathyarchaeia archaeon]